jgi:alpha/beta superfamily hydrolase
VAGVGTQTTTRTLVAADGVALEAEARVPSDAWAAAVLAHPHPLYGGSMRSIVPSTLFSALPDAGIACLRFNFRGVEGSGGTHGDGVAERLDVAAAVAALAELAPGLPLAVVGWSFGADVSLAVTDARIGGWLAVAPPLRTHPADMAAATDPRPKLIAVPERDQFRPPESARAVVAGWVNTRLEVIPGADHFLAGRTDRVAELAADFCRALADAAPPA